MTVLTINTNASWDGNSAKTCGYVDSVFAGEAIEKMAATRMGSDGKIYNASTSYKTSGSVCHFLGFAFDKVAVNQPVTLYKAPAIASYSTNMTPGTYLYISASATKGQLSDAPVLGVTDEPVALAISSTDVIILK